MIQALLTGAAIARGCCFIIAAAGRGGRRAGAVLRVQHDVDGVCKGGEKLSCNVVCLLAFGSLVRHMLRAQPWHCPLSHPSSLLILGILSSQVRPANPATQPILSTHRSGLHASLPSHWSIP